MLPLGVRIRYKIAGIIMRIKIIGHLWPYIYCPYCGGWGNCFKKGLRGHEAQEVG